jgi:ribosomal protein L7/L12
MTKRDLWLSAMKNVAEAHHALIVTEYNRLCESAGLVVSIGSTTRADMVTWAKHWILNDVKSPVGIAPYPRTIMCIKEIRMHFNLSLRDAKDIADEAVAFLRANGSIT